MNTCISKERVIGGKLEEEEELNILPVMNTFLILIPFLVSMAVFTRIAVIPVNLPADVGMGKGPEKSELKLTVVIHRNDWKIILGDSLISSHSDIGAANSRTALKEALERVRPALTNRDEAVLAVSDGISFDHVVQVMDAVRESGFERLSLSGSAEDKMDLPLDVSAKNSTGDKS